MRAAAMFVMASATAMRPDAGAIKGLGSLGYRQVAAALRGEISMEEALRDTQTATRHYAKRQMTWFRREDGMNWFAGFGDHPDLQQQVLIALKGWIESKFNGASFLPKVVSL